MAVPALPASLALTRHFVGGRFVESSARFDNICPVNGECIAQVCEADAGLVHEAVTAARAAVAGPWGRSSVQQRAQLLQRVADGIEQRFEDFLAAEVADTGRPLRQSGALERLPSSLKICFAHGGGSFAWLIGRVDNAWRQRDIVRKDCPELPSSYARRLHVDAAVFDTGALRLLCEVMGKTNVMQGTDAPFPLGEPRCGELVNRSDFLDVNDKQRILRGNALNFFGL